MIKNIKISPYLLIYLFIYDIPRGIFMLLFNRYTIKAIKEIKELYPVMLAKRGSKVVDSGA